MYERDPLMSFRSCAVCVSWWRRVRARSADVFQIVCCMCELVEACTSEIRSGWRPLFAALRAVRIQYTANEEVNEARQRHVTAVLDVFDVFLDTENAHVFANAAVDCILCLHKYVRGQGMNTTVNCVILVSSLACRLCLNDIIFIQLYILLCVF